jgi:hypothetical protein
MKPKRGGIGHAVILFSVVAFAVALCAIAVSRALLMHALPRAYDEGSWHPVSTAQCNYNNSLPFLMLKDTMSLPARDTDEFGSASDYLSLAAVVKGMEDLGAFAADGSRFAVNLGARDGIGTMGNTDPTWPLFRDMGFSGIAVEGSPVFKEELERNFRGLNVTPVISMVTPENAVHLIMGFGIVRVDVLKIDIDSWDCDVLPAILGREELGVKVVLVEYNVKFPPPVKMALATYPRTAFRSCARYHVYECSLQYMNDDVMAQFGYVLAQVDWQNAIYVHRTMASKFLGIPEQGINVREAYMHGYADRPGRSVNMPWNHDIDHLLHKATPFETLQESVAYILQGYHLQDGSVLLGCGSELQVFHYNRSPKIRKWDRVGDC